MVIESDSDGEITLDKSNDDNFDHRAKLDFHKTYVEASDSDNNITEDADHDNLDSSLDDDVPLVQLGTDFLSDSKLEKISSWVRDSPFRERLSDYSSRIQASPLNSSSESNQEIESLLKSDPEDGEIVPSWKAPLPLQDSFRRNLSQDDRSSKAMLTNNSTKTTSTFVPERSSKELISGSSTTSGTNIHSKLHEDSSKALISNKSSSSSGTEVEDERSSKAAENNSFSLKISASLSPSSTSKNEIISSPGEVGTSKAIIMSNYSSEATRTPSENDRSSKVMINGVPTQASVSSAKNSKIITKFNEKSKFASPVNQFRIKERDQVEVSNISLSDNHGPTLYNEEGTGKNDCSKKLLSCKSNLYSEDSSKGRVVIGFFGTYGIKKVDLLLNL